MPYLSRPIEAIPDTAIVLAESPSVNMRVHSNDLPVPASLASSNLGIPKEYIYSLLVKFQTNLYKNI